MPLLMQSCGSVEVSHGKIRVRLDFLKDDTGAGLKVDAYYEPLKLVVEYRTLSAIYVASFLLLPITTESV